MPIRSAPRLRRELRADLVGAPGLDAHLEQGAHSFSPQHLHPADRRLRAPIAARRDVGAAIAAAREPMLERAIAAAPALDQRDVALVDRALLELPREPGVRLLALRVHQHTGGVLIEPLVDAEVRDAAAVALAEEAPEPVHEIVRVRRIGRLARHALRLVDRDQLAVLVDDPRRIEDGRRDHSMCSRSLRGRISEGSPVVVTQSWCAARVAAMWSRWRASSSVG